MLQAHLPQRPHRERDRVTLGSELARLRMEHRARRLELVVRELRRRVEDHAQRGGSVPVPLQEALTEFAGELSEVRRKIAESPARASAAGSRFRDRQIRNGPRCAPAR